jgi:APA family basic amino acid/polyamine antiporter
VPATVTLQRRLGPGDAAAVVISNVIGGGILFVPIFVAQLAPEPWAILGIWATGGLLAFAGAMSYAELAALRPRSGGEYVYLREAFGPLVAFLTGWTSFVAGFSGAIAASAVGFANYLGRFVPFAADRTPWLSIEIGPLTPTLSPQTLIAVTLIAVLSAVHVLGLGPGRLVQNLLASIKVLALLAFVAAGLTIGKGTFAHFSNGDGNPVTASGWLLALVPVMFSYSGWNAAAYIAEEIRDPGRNVPRALAVGTIAVVLVYLAMNVVYLYALPVSTLMTLRGGVRIVDAAADTLFGAFAGNLMALVTLLIAAGSISAMVLAGPRVYYAMARDGLFLKSASHVHPAWRTPAGSIVAQAVWSAVLVISGSFEQLANYTGFAIMLFGAIAVTSLFVLRRRFPDEPRPFRALGYPVAPGLFAIVCYAASINAIWRTPATSATGLGIIALGIPIYFLIRRTPPAPELATPGSD